ncbi:MAG: metallophosphoesterase [Rhodoferax sp.]|uniref:metallophosphoesterase family protein n=1 Tax=Rhodoferax sp. TaxID=50421 RepID=UPI00260E9BB8|nr:metallophosphoesterase [Rhodoferax sp.]MDD2882498.1 metallophosphoesterase [Rhodoferax sp.]
MIRGIQAFDAEHAQVLSRIWFMGDVHGEFKHIARALLEAPEKPSWLVFLGDIDIDHISFREILAPLRRNFPNTKVGFIHGNHDADTYEHWEMLHDCGDAVALHGQVLELDGVKVAGLGGNFMGRIWNPPTQATFQSKDKAMNRGPYQWRDGQRPDPSLYAAIYPSDFERLAKLRADILVTHEAPSCHPYGFEAIDDLARSMRVVRSFHGHQHDDRSDEYALVRDKMGFDAKAVNYCGIKNGLGHLIHSGPKGW